MQDRRGHAMWKVLKFLIVLVILISIPGFLFYWYEYRPSQIRKECVGIAETKARDMMKIRAKDDTYVREKAHKGWYLKNDFEESYIRCLRENGIEK